MTTASGNMRGLSAKSKSVHCIVHVGKPKIVTEDCLGCWLPNYQPIYIANALEWPSRRAYNQRSRALRSKITSIKLMNFWIGTRNQSTYAS